MDFIESFKRASALLAIGMMWAGGAEASSIITVDPPKSGATPSIVVLGATQSPPVAAAPAQSDPDVVAGNLDKPNGEPPAQIGDGVELSSSVIALGEPGVETGKVAAIDNTAGATARHFSLPVMVIRGGVVGDAFSPPTASQPASTQPAGAKTGDAKTPASSTGEAAAGEQQASDTGANVKAPVSPKPAGTPPATSYPAAQPSAPASTSAPMSSK
jgi:hypothetical protein